MGKKNKTIELSVSIFKENKLEFTENEVDDFMDEFVKFIKGKELSFGGGHELV